MKVFFYFLSLFHCFFLLFFTYFHSFSVIYIDTELKFDVARVIQIACLAYPDLYSVSNENASENIENFMKRLKVSL